MLRQSGQLTEALPAAMEARRRLEEFGDVRDTYALHLLAHIHQDRGELDTALALQQEEVVGVRASGRSQDLAESLERLAAIYRDRGEYPAARRTAKEAVDLTVEVHDELVECHARTTLGDAFLGLDELPAALAARTAVALHEESGAMVHLAAAREILREIQA
jgi:tetratricopeptide (TPR) repeat protein